MADPERLPLILGTAGHIDHGKTSLIEALTGIDTDRLPEEKARGITIELGFAPLDLDDGLRLGVVDVPGHEGLVRTMVAGAAGIDLVLLVIAADEGVMPQTREHLAICDLLGLQLGVVALTKADLVDEEMLELAQEEAVDLVGETCLSGAKVIPVSSLSGQGLTELREALSEAATVAEARTPRSGPPRLWIDRRFEMRGFGSVVTGTLIGAPLAVGDPVELLPRGGVGRVRGLQSFGEKVDSVQPGARCAVNLQNVPLAELSRGLLLSRPEALAPTHRFDALLHWLPGAPLLENDPYSVELLCGTAERRARVAPIGTTEIKPGSKGFARIHVDGDALGLLPGDRFVLRGFHRAESAGATLGGGRVLDVCPPQRRRNDPALVEDLEILAGEDAAASLRCRISRAGFAAISKQKLSRETGFSSQEVSRCLDDQDAAVLALGPERWIATSARGELADRLQVALHDFHDREPLEPGMPRATLGGCLPENVPPAAFDFLLAHLVDLGAIEIEEKIIRAADFVPRLTQAQEALAARLRADAMIAALEPPTLSEWSVELAIPQDELRPVLAHLERDGSLTRTPGDLWFDKVAVDELREKVIAHLQAHEELPTPAYKEMIGTTRKYAVPLMELFDAEHLTLRRGEARVLRRKPAGPRERQ